MSGNSFWGSLTSSLSNFADGVGDLFNVGSTVSTSSNIKPDDVLKTKTALNAVGSYDVPDFGITDIPDTGMIDGLKNFQANNGLKVDGVMKPGGPTENALGQTLANQGISTTDMMEKVKTPSITPMSEMPKPVSPPQTSWSASAPIGEVPKPSRPKLPKINPMTGLEDLLASAPKGKMPTKKQWEEVAKMQQQNAKTAIIPQGDTVDQRIRSMMSDKRYDDKHDTRLREHVQKQFQNAYPGNLEYDETGKMIQPTAAIRPQDVEPFDPDGELKSMEIFNDQNEETVAQGYGLQSTDGQNTPAQTFNAKPIHYFGKDGKPKSVIDKGDSTFVDLNGQPVQGVPDWMTRRDENTAQVKVASNTQTMNDASPDANEMFPVKDPTTGKEYQVDMNGNYYDDNGKPVSLSDDVQQRLNDQFANDTDDEIDEKSEKLPQDHSYQSNEESKFNPDDFVDSLSDNAESKSKGRCAAYVRRALEADGLDSSGPPEMQRIGDQHWKRTGSCQSIPTITSPKKVMSWLSNHIPAETKQVTWQPTAAISGFLTSSSATCGQDRAIASTSHPMSSIARCVSILLIGLWVSCNAYAQEADTPPPTLTDAEIHANTSGFSAPKSDAERAVDAILTYNTLASSDRRFGDLMDYMIGYPNRNTDFDHLYDQFFTPALTKAWRTAERHQVQKDCDGQYIEGEQCGLGFNPLTCAQDDPAQGYEYRTERKTKDAASVTITWQGQPKPLATYLVTKQGKDWVVDGVSCLNGVQFNWQTIKHD